MLAGKRILIVEDEPLIALDLETAIVDLQGSVIGSVRTITEALRIAEFEDFDGAILDLQLKEGMAHPVAECLSKRAIPFVIHSGQSEITSPRARPDVPIISKPALPEQVIKVLAALMHK